MTDVKVGDKIKILVDYASGTHELAGAVLTVTRLGIECFYTDRSSNPYPSLIRYEWVFLENDLKEGLIEILSSNQDYASSVSPSVNSERTLKIDSDSSVELILTKREYFAAMAMQGLSSFALPTDHHLRGIADQEFNQCIAINAVERADALIAELNKKDAKSVS